MPVYHKPVQRASAADGAEENNGKPANDTPEQEADVPPDSRVPKRDAVYRSPTLGDSVVQMLHHMGRIFEDNSKADGTLYGLRIDRKRRRELQRKRPLPWDTSPTIMKRYRIHSAEPRHR